MQRFHLDKVTYKILKKERTNIDRAMLVIGVAGPLATIPQIIVIFTRKQVEGISVLSWWFYAVSSLLTLLYAVVHRLRPLIVSSVLWLVCDAIIIAGCIIFR
jgi:uncharacterized protein with PQ loop repeat